MQWSAVHRPELSQTTKRRAALAGPTSRASAVLQPIAEPDRAAFENLTAFQRHRAERSSRVGLVLARIEGVGPALRAVHRRADRKADLVDQAGPQKRAVRLAAAFEQQALDPQLTVQDLQRERQIELPFAGEDVGDAVAAQPRQMRVGDLLGQHRDDRVAPDIRATPSDLAVRVERDAVNGGVALDAGRMSSRFVRLCYKNWPFVSSGLNPKRRGRQILAAGKAGSS